MAEELENLLELGRQDTVRFGANGLKSTAAIFK